MFLRGKGQHL
jgi:Ras-related protein Rap-1B